MGTLSVLCVVLVALPAWGAKAPNIVFMLTDDLGYNSPGYHNTDLITPTLDSLAADGVKLEGHYVYKYCSPTRGSFHTGRFPYHLAATRSNLIPWDLPDGINTTYTYLPKMLKKANYRSTIIGKWHQGFYTRDMMPLGRGYDESFVFLTGGEDHNTQITFNAQGAPCKNSVDLHQNGEPAYGRNGTYSGEMFTRAAVEAIHKHSAQHSDQPMFLYYALHNTHAPVEAPTRFISKYHFPQALRSTFDAMVSVVDESAANVTQALKQTGMWENTLFVWTTDNGSPVQVAGSNFPLKGGKGSNWEGGVRVPGFINGGLVPKSERGSTRDGLIHICDWYSTFAHLAGVDPTDESGPAPIESLNQWPYLSGQVSESVRTEIVHDHRMFDDNEPSGAIRIGDWKLFVGPEKQSSWFGQFSPNVTGHAPPLNETQCSLTAPCLFNIKQDPTEHFDVAQANPEVVSSMLFRFHELANTYHPPKKDPPRQPNAYCNAIAAHQNFVSHWQD